MYPTIFSLPHHTLCLGGSPGKHCPDYTAMILTQKQLFSPPPFPPFSYTHHNTGKGGGQRLSLPQWLHPSYYPPLEQVWRKKWMLSLLSNPCVRLSSPVAHVDHLPCCIHTAHIHTHSPCTAPPSPNLQSEGVSLTNSQRKNRFSSPS